MEREWKHRETRGFFRERERENATVVRHEIVSRPTRECKRRVGRDCYQTYERVQATREDEVVTRDTRECKHNDNEFSPKKVRVCAERLVAGTLGDPPSHSAFCSLLGQNNLTNASLGNVPPLAPTAACMIFLSFLSHHPSPSLSLFIAWRIELRWLLPCTCEVIFFFFFTGSKSHPRHLLLLLLFHVSGSSTSVV
ncbi:hypothetical protein BDL97_08G139100 [Sphagnum fallax]|nr:hypothetical protein BDL97_08G139100 [Sphagnum fallax]